MRIGNVVWDFKRKGEVIAGFGQARLVKKLDSTYELLGGSEDDRQAAKEWISLFFHEAVIRDASGRCF